MLGWANHEGLWRSNAPDVATRLAEIKLFYTTPNPLVAAEVLRRYGVTHVVVGDMERRLYGGAGGGAERSTFLSPVFSSGGTTIYAVARAPEMKILMALDYYRPNYSGLTLFAEQLAGGLAAPRPHGFRPDPPAPARAAARRRRGRRARRPGRRRRVGSEKPSSPPRSSRGRSPRCRAPTCFTSTPRSSTPCPSR